MLKPPDILGKSIMAEDSPYQTLKRPGNIAGKVAFVGASTALGGATGLALSGTMLGLSHLRNNSMNKQSEEFQPSKDGKHNWQPALTAGAADVPVGLAASATGMYAASKLGDKINNGLSKVAPHAEAAANKLGKAMPGKIADKAMALAKALPHSGHGIANAVGGTLLAGGAAFAYTDHLQRKHEKAERLARLGNNDMSKSAETNKYLEKIAEITAEQQRALDRGYDRPWVQAGIGGLVGNVAGGVVGGIAASAAHNPALASLGAVGGLIGGAMAGHRVAKKNNTVLDKLRETHPDEVDQAVIRDGRKSHIAGFVASPLGIPGVLDTTESNNRYEAALRRLSEKRDGK